MRFLYFLFLILLLINIKALSQSCLPLGIEFNTQAQIDSFPINYPGCTEIEGDVKVKGSGISNLNGLSSVTAIGGDLRIEINPDLSSLMGLSALTSIGRDLVFVGNYSLTNLSGLGSLESIGRDLLLYYNSFTSFSGLGPITTINRHLWIIGNSSITDLSGLETLTYIRNGTIKENASLTSLSGLDSLTFIGNLVIFYNPSLTSLCGLDAVTHIDQILTINSNNALINLTGVSKLSYVGHFVSIYFNPSLIGLNGLESLTFIGQYLDIIGNDSLISLSGLCSLTSIGSWIEIKNNPSLSSLSGLDNIDANSITALYIENNNSLSTCAVQSICDYLAALNGIVSIFGNATGCNSQAEVEAACADNVIELNLKVFLQGTYAGNNIMNTNLSSVLPFDQPYDTMPWMYQGMETINNIPPNMVDWILIELRDSADYSIVNDTRAAILLSDGSVKDTDLVNGVCFHNVDSGYYYVVVRHHNHISVMTELPVDISSQILLDFSDTNTVKPFGGATQAQIELEPGIWGMICGDINQDGILKFSGPDNDRMKIIQLITNVSGSTNITKVINGYYFEDLDLNSEVKYSGPGNDGSIIIRNIISLTGSTNITTVYSCPVMFLYQ